MVEPAPGRFSMTTCCPNASDRRCVRMRPGTSAAPPAENGMIMRTVREGYAWAAAPPATWQRPAPASNACPALRTKQFMGLLLPFYSVHRADSANHSVRQSESLTRFGFPVALVCACYYRRQSSEDSMDEN